MATMVKHGLTLSRLMISTANRPLLALPKLSGSAVARPAAHIAVGQRTINCTARRLASTQAVPSAADTRTEDCEIIADVMCPNVVNPAPQIPVSAPEIAQLPIATHDDVLLSITRRHRTILDVRTPFEAKAFGKIPNSVLISHEKVEYAMNLTPSDFRLEFGFYKPDTFSEAVIVYCRSGARAKLAAVILRDKFGFRNVSVYEGSWLEWQELHPEDVISPMPATAEAVFRMMSAAAVLAKRRLFEKIYMTR